MDRCSIDTGKERKDNSGIDLSSTVDGRNPKQSPGMYKTLVNNGINYQPQVVFLRRISAINSGLSSFHAESKS